MLVNKELVALHAATYQCNYGNPLPLLDSFLFVLLLSND